MITEHDMTYPQPLYQRAVNAYLRAFCEKHGLSETDITEVGVPEYPTYAVDPWNAIIHFDDIRLDIDGMDYNGRHITAHADAMPEHLAQNEDAYYKGERTINYRTYLLNL